MGEGERSCSTAQRGVRGTVREGVNRKSGILFSFQLLLIEECNDQLWYLSVQGV